MELLEIENLDLENNNFKAVFDGMFPQGFYIKTEFDYDDEVVESACEETNYKESLAATNISFHDFKIFNSDSELISVNDRETKKIKQLIEFKLIDSLNDYLNNN